MKRFLVTTPIVLVLCIAFFLCPAFTQASLPTDDSPVSLEEQAVRDLADYVFILDIVNGITISLDAKLDTALQALDDLNENNDAAAVNSLGAFINAVQAQRGNKIDDADADYLVVAANHIIIWLLLEDCSYGDCTVPGCTCAPPCPIGTCSGS